LDVLTKYKILGFCGLGLNRLKFYQTKTYVVLFCPGMSWYFHKQA